MYIPSHDDWVDIVVEDDNFPTVEKINPHAENARFDFSKIPEDDPEISKLLMNEVGLIEFSKIPAHIELAPLGHEMEQIHHLRYYAFYSYPFHVGYSFPNLPFAEEFCHYYRICPAQLSPYNYKFIRMISKHAELAGVEVSVLHLMHLFAPSFHQATMLHLLYRGGKCLVVR